MMSNFSKKLKEEGSSRLHSAISETLGLMVWNITNNMEDKKAQEKVYMKHFFRVPLSTLQKSSSKVSQAGCVQCLAKIIINCPDSLLMTKLEEITDNLVELFKLKTFQAHKELLECIISIVFHIQDEFAAFYPKFLPVLTD